jgi:hypothetical protein
MRIHESLVLLSLRFCCDLPNGGELSAPGARPQRMNDTLANRPRGRSKEMLRRGSYVTVARASSRQTADNPRNAGAVSSARELAQFFLIRG